MLVRSHGACMSRLDRILVSPNWLMEWGDVNLWALPRDISDHCPIILRYSNFDWGPKPFRFNNHWLKNKGFREVLKEGWSSTLVVGWKGVVVKEKLKALKEVLKRWNREVYEGFEEKILALTKEVERLDLKREVGVFGDDDNVAQKTCLLDLCNLLHSKDSLLFQRSRSRWCVEPVEVRGEVVGFFKKHYAEVNWRRPQLDGVEFPSLSPEQIESLGKPFLVDEV
ncbi:unnamed protein product, partial [Trifolium pratense]